MSNELQARLDRVRHALGVTRSESLDELKVDRTVGSGSISFFLDFNQGRTPTDLEYAAYALIANIASLKDHLKHWCGKHSKPYSGDSLINSNRSVALVHDLWNTDKHASLDKSRSGMRPALRDLHQTMSLETGTTARSWAIVTLDPQQGVPIAHTGGTGSAALVIDAQIVDEHGSEVGWLQNVCAEAIDEWEGEMRRAGAPIT